MSSRCLSPWARATDYGLKFTFHESWKLERTFHHVVGHFPLTGHPPALHRLLPPSIHAPSRTDIHFYPLPSANTDSTNFGTCKWNRNWQRVLVIPTKNSVYRTKVLDVKSSLASLCSGDQLGAVRHTSCSERSRQRTGSPRVLSTPFHALTCAREARLVRAPYQPPPPVLPPPLVTSSRYHHYSITIATTTTPSPLPSPSLSAAATLVVYYWTTTAYATTTISNTGDLTSPRIQPPSHPQALSSRSAAYENAAERRGRKGIASEKIPWQRTARRWRSALALAPVIVVVCVTPLWCQARRSLWQ